MHNGAKYTAEALPKVIEGLQEKGYEIVPISKLIYKDNYHMEHDGSQVSDKREGKSSDKSESNTDSQKETNKK